MEALKPLTKCTVEWGLSDPAQEAQEGVLESEQRFGQAEEAQHDRRRQQQPAEAGEEGNGGRRRRQHGAELRHAQALLSHLLLLQSSRPLHKQLLSGLRPLLEQQQHWLAAGQVRKEDTFAGIAAARIAELASTYLAAADGGGDGYGSSEAAADAAVPGSPAEPALALGSALAALLANAACKAALVECAVPAVAALARGIRVVLAPDPASGAGAAAAGAAVGPSAEAAGEAGADRTAAHAGPSTSTREAAVDGQDPPEGAAYLTTTVMEGVQDCSEWLPCNAVFGGRGGWGRLPAAAACGILASGRMHAARVCCRKRRSICASLQAHALRFCWQRRLP